MTRETTEESASRAGSRVVLEAVDSFSYSIRHPEEVDMIQDRAHELGIGRSALARNLIRNGLAAGKSDDVADAIDRLGQVVDDLRSPDRP